MKQVGIGLCLFGLLALQTPLAAHGGCGCGHSHGEIVAPHGGIMEHNNDASLWVEVVSHDDYLQIYVMDEHQNALSTASVALRGGIEIPRSKQPVSASFEPREDFFIGRFEMPRRAHRYTLNLDVNYKGKQERLSYVIER